MTLKSGIDFFSKRFFYSVYLIHLISILIVGVCELMNLQTVDAAEPKTATESVQRNVLLICVDDLRPELACFGADYIHSPNIDALAERGVRFRRHYVQAPTCGASRYTLLTGRYGPTSNGALFSRAKKVTQNPDQVAASMPAWLKQHGYTTVSVGKVSHHPGGRGGSDWDDDSNPEMPFSWDRHLMPCGPWQHPRGAMHGLAHGEIRKNAKEMAVYQSEEGDDEIYPDGLILNQAKAELKQLASDSKPFFMAVGFIRPHLPFGAPAEYMKPYQDAQLPLTAHPQKPTGKTTWHRSGEFMKYNRWGRDPNVDVEFAVQCRLHYAACVTYADAMVGQLLNELKATGQADNTVVILWGDHGWHLGEHAIWGKHALFEESLHSPLIVSVPGTSSAGKAVDNIVETLDIFPTVCEACSVPTPETVHGESLMATIAGEAAQDEATQAEAFAVSYSKATTIRTNQYRLIRHSDGAVELYDHNSEAAETQNVADQHPDMVQKLTQQLAQRLKDRD